MRCQAKKNNGEQCSRKTDPKSKYCWQHQPDEKQKMRNKLTEKQKAFADEYIISLNATEAAKKAGYKEKSAYSIGHENLKKPEVQEYIEKRLKEKEEKRIATQDEVLEYLTKVMRGEEADILSGVAEYGPVVEEVQASLNERTKAAKLLGKRYAMFKDVQDVNLDGGVQIIDDVE